MEQWPTGYRSGGSSCPKSTGLRVRGDRCHFGIRTAQTVLVLGVVSAIAASSSAEAALVGETIQLQSGWNAVCFNVEPEPSEITAFLASQAPPLDCQAVWTFEPSRNVTLDPAVDAPGRWFFYDKSVPSALHTLRTLQGRRAYLFKVNVGGPLRLSGSPVIRPIAFSGRVSNLIGAMSDPFGPALTFEKFFTHPSAAGKVVAGSVPLRHDIFSITDTGFSRGRLIDPIEPNRAYWINVVQDFQYAGPLDATASANGLSFGRGAALRTLVIDLPASPAARTVNVRARPCTELDGADCFASGVGADWLEYRVTSTSPVPEWQPLTNGLDVLVPAGATKLSLELRAKRTAVAAVPRGGDGSATLPPLTVEVTDGEGSLTLIPADVEVEPVFGLWAGKAVLTKVGVHPSIQDAPFEQAAAPPLVMTLMLDLPAPED